MWVFATQALIAHLPGSDCYLVQRAAVWSASGVFLSLCWLVLFVLARDSSDLFYNSGPVNSGFDLLTLLCMFSI